MVSDACRRASAAIRRWVVLSLLEGAVSTASAQGPTTASISGRIVDARGRGVAGVEVVVLNQASGISMRGLSRSEGRYLVGGLEVGGPYTVTMRQIGSPMVKRTGVFLSLGQQLQLDVTLEQQPAMLQAIETQAKADRLFSRGHMGAQSFISDSTLRRAPVINRDLYDLVRLVPQISTWFDLSASGAGPRVNSIQIDGITDQVPTSNLAAGALYGGRVLPLDAVKEFQVSLSPYDVRNGSFAGASVNVVTRSGTNELHGSLFGYGTNDHFGADVPLIRSSPYEKEQLGFSLGGPIVRDRLLFFVSSEIQRRVLPAAGAYIGDDPSTQSALSVRAADIARFQELLKVQGLDGGSAGAVSNPNPSSSVFARLDAPFARWNSRVTLRGNYGHADSAIFARPTALAPTNCPTNACFPLSSLQHSRWVEKRSSSAQLISNSGRGLYNELLAGYVSIASGFHAGVKQPLILVTVPGTSGAPAVLQSGTHEIATGQRNTSWTVDLGDHLSISRGAHRITAGATAQLFDFRAFQLRGAYGIWEFSSLDSLQAGTASRYRVTRDTGSVTAASGGYYAVHLGDEWEASSRLTLTVGLRADIPQLSARPSYVAAVDSVFGLRSDEVPSGHVQLSPRVGFNYNLTSFDQSPGQLRGGIGLFTGRPPMFWLFGGFSAYGLATRTLQCGSLAGDAGPPPAFHPDYRSPPLACAGGGTFGASTTGEIDVIDPRVRLPQTMRASLAVDHALPFGLVGTMEALYTRSTRALFFAPLNLRESVATDRNGRAMYGSIGPTGVAAPARIVPSLGDVVSIGTQSRDYAYDLTTELRREGRLVEVDASFSLGRARDVQTPRPVSALLVDDWRFSRPVTGDPTDLTLTTSDFDQPYRVRAFGTLHSPWRSLRTDLTLLYIGGSGLPFTYIAGGAAGRGDLNADGAVGNDPIYIPRSALDTNEIRFAGTTAEVAAQQVAFEHFLDGASCLRRQRGRIMSRNSCRSPWMSRTNLALRQALPAAGTHWFFIELQVFNLLNLVNPRWGRVALPTGAAISSTNQTQLLSQVGETAGTSAQPIFRFDPQMGRFNFDNLDSYYQLQLALRYDF